MIGVLIEANKCLIMLNPDIMATFIKRQYTQTLVWYQIIGGDELHFKPGVDVPIKYSL